MKLKRSFIPNIFTIFNMFAGFLAILEILQGRYITAVMLILAAMIFDTLDGQIARWLQQQSDFGIEFDSLADLVSFCVTPTLLVYSLYVADLGFLGALISFFPLLFGGIRLARFNITATSYKKRYFTGLPVPAMASCIGSFIWFNKTVFGHYGNPRVALPLVIVLSFLMVSNIRFGSNFHLDFHRNRMGVLRSSGILVAGIVILLFRGYVIFPMMVIYIATHLLNWIVGYEEPRGYFFVRRKDKL